MERRTLLGLVSGSTLFPLSGCIFQRYSDQGLGRSVDVTVYNRTDDEQNVAVTVTEDGDETVHAERYVLSPEDGGNHNHREPEVGRANRTYQVEVTTDDLRAEQEVEPSQAGVIDIGILEGGIRINFAAAEG